MENQQDTEIHSLVNSIMVVNINKRASDERVPVPMLLGIQPPHQVMIQPCNNQSLVMLSKVSIKNHPHHEQIVDLAKEIYVGEPKHLRQGKSARDYLLQAKVMFKSTQSNCLATTPPAWPLPKSGMLGNTKDKVLFVQTVKEWGAPVFPPKRSPTSIPVLPKPKGDWQTVQ